VSIQRRTLLLGLSTPALIFANTGPATASSLLNGIAFASLSYTVAPQVEYIEEVFLGEKSRRADFGSAWESSRDMTGWLHDSLWGAQFNSKSAIDAIPEDEFGRIVAASSATLSTAKQGTRDWAERMSTPIDPQTLQRLSKHSGVTHLLELFTPAIALTARAIAAARLSTYVYVRITRLTESAVVAFQGRFLAIEDVSLGGRDPKTFLESNDLAPLKSFVRRAIELLPRVELVDSLAPPKLVYPTTIGK
jgi:hypothetical protein